MWHDSVALASRTGALQLSSHTRLKTMVSLGEAKNFNVNVLPQLICMKKMLNPVSEKHIYSECDKSLTSNN